MRRVILGITLLILLGMLLFPPHRVTRIDPDASIPSLREEAVTTYRAFWTSRSWEQGEYRYEKAEVVTTQLAIQIGFVVCLGAGGALLVKREE